MAETKELEHHLRSLALLYLAMGHGTDSYLSNAELDEITDRLHARYPTRERSAIQDLVGEAMSLYAESENVVGSAMKVIAGLKSSLDYQQRNAILEDLMAIAQADGVVLHNERILMSILAQSWGFVQRNPAVVQQPEEGTSGWDVLHYLSLIYLVLAHGADNDLSGQERSVMLKKLEEWAPRHDEEEIADILDVALAQYARGVSDELFAQSVQAVRKGMPEVQRMAALDDLIKIANADGVFLDREEDLINQILSAWRVDPYANYGGHGAKAEQDEKS